MKITMNSESEEILGKNLNVTDIIEMECGIGIVIKASHTRNNNLEVLPLNSDLGGKEILCFTGDTPFILYKNAELIINK